MGILSKFRQKKSGEVKKITPKTTKAEPKSESVSDNVPVIDDISKWKKEVKKLANEGIDGIYDFFKKELPRAKTFDDVKVKMAIVAMNYFIFRRDLYNHLGEYYGDMKKAIKEVDAIMKDIDEEFIEAMLEVIRKWSTR